MLYIYIQTSSFRILFQCQRLIFVISCIYIIIYTSLLYKKNIQLTHIDTAMIYTYAYTPYINSIWCTYITSLLSYFISNMTVLLNNIT